MNRIEREKQVVRHMMSIYCRRHHGGGDRLCTQCSELLDYACNRLSHCPHGERKPSCRKCKIHCYSPAKRESIRMVMRFSGPRMLWHSPGSALRHLWRELR